MRRLVGDIAIGNTWSASGEMYVPLICVHLLSVVFASFPRSTYANRRSTSYWGGPKAGSCTREQEDKLFSIIKLSPKFRRFFEPDCDKGKLVFQPQKQGCLGALRNLEDEYRPRNKSDKRYKTLSKLIICTHKACTDLPVFRRCGSNEPHHKNPRSFRNGCRQCAASCKEVVSGRRRYVRLEMEKCPKRNKPVTPDQMVVPRTTENRPIQKTARAPTTSTMVSTKADLTTVTPTTKPVTTRSMTTELQTTKLPAKCEQAVRAPVQELSKDQQCYLKGFPVSRRIECSLIGNVIGKIHLPPLPPWEPEDNR